MWAAACGGSDTGTGDHTGRSGVETTARSAPRLDERVQSLATRAGYAVDDVADETCQTLHGIGLERPVPVASVFKLWMLDALARQIDAGDLEWDDTVVVRDNLRSDPSGRSTASPRARRCRCSISPS